MMRAALALCLMAQAAMAAAQENIRFPVGWSAAERAAIERFYERVSPLSRSSHWHDWDCCQSNRCFPARPGSVRWTPDGMAITLPDGDVMLVAEDDPLWRPKPPKGREDPRFHVCFEIVNGEWTIVCAYRAEVMG